VGKYYQILVPPMVIIKFLYLIFTITTLLLDLTLVTFYFKVT